MGLRRKIIETIFAFLLLLVPFCVASSVTFPHSEAASFPVQITGYQYTPFPIYPGYPFTFLQVFLLNAGSTPIANTTVILQTVQPVQPAINGSNSKYIGTLPPSTPVPVTFMLEIANSSQAMNSTLTLNVLYNSGSASNFSIPFVEYPKATLAVMRTDSTTVYVGDGSDQLTFTVKNVGLAPAQFTELTLLPSNVFQVSIPSSINPLVALTMLNSSVGTLLPGQQGEATYLIQVSSSVNPGTYPLSFIASWRQNGATQPFVQQIIIPISIKETLSQSIYSFFVSNILIFIIIIVVIIAAAVATVASRRRRKRGVSKPGENYNG
jgi:hypothetical protein